MAIRWSEKLFNYPLAYRAKFAVTGAVVAVLKPAIFKEYFTIEQVLDEDIPKTASVLEIGCGDGHNYDLLKKSGWNGAFTGIDVNPAMVEHCKRTYPEARWLLAGAPPYEVEAHDIVLIVNLLHHLDGQPQIEAFLAEALRIGKAIVLFEPMQSENAGLHALKKLYWTVTDGGNLYYRHGDFKKTYAALNIKVVKERLTAPLRQFYAAVLTR